MAGDGRKRSNYNPRESKRTMEIGKERERQRRLAPREKIAADVEGGRKWEEISFI